MQKVLFSMAEATVGALNPVLGSPVQERHEHTGKSTAKSRKNDYGFGAALLGGKVERAGTVHPGEEKIRGISSM